MTDEQAMALGRRAVACRAWRWMPGMLLLNRPGDRVLRWDGDDCTPEAGGLTLGPGYIDTYEWEPGADDVPDLRDSATVGALEDLARGAHPGKRLYCFPLYGATVKDAGWTVYVEDGGYEHDSALELGFEYEVSPGPYRTRAEAWVVALEVAP